MPPRPGTIFCRFLVETRLCADLPLTLERNLSGISLKRIIGHKRWGPEFAKRRARVALRPNVEDATADRARDRKASRKKRLEDAGDYLAGAEGSNLCRLNFDALTDHIELELNPPKREGPKRLSDLLEALNPAEARKITRLKKILGHLGAAEIAGVAIASLLQALFEIEGDESSPSLTIKLRMGEALRHKLDEHRLLRKRPKTYKWLKKTDRGRRNQTARDRALDKWLVKAGFGAREWSPTMTTRAGEWLLQRCVKGLPHVFGVDDDGVPYVREEAIDLAKQLGVATAEYRPVLHPMSGIAAAATGIGPDHQQRPERCVSASFRWRRCLPTQTLSTCACGSNATSYPYSASRRPRLRIARLAVVDLPREVLRPQRVGVVEAHTPQTIAGRNPTFETLQRLNNAGS